MVSYDPYPTAPISDFYAELAFEFQDLPTELFQYYVTRVAREMAREAPILRRRLKIPLQPGVTRYQVVSPDGLEVDRILDARHVPDGVEEHGSRKLPRFLTPPEHQCPHFKGVWYEPESGVMVIHTPFPGALVIVTLAALPDRKACELPTIYRDTLLPTLLMGVKGSLLMITGRPWTNVRVGGELYNEYRRLLSDEAVKYALHGQRGIIMMNHGKVM